MSIRHVLQARGLPLDLVDYAHWPKVDVRTIQNKKHRARFRNLQAAAQLFCGGGHSYRTVAAATGIAHTTIQYFIDRALKLHDDGRINGERAFVRFQVRAEHKATGQPVENYTCQFKALLDRHPSIKEVIRKSLIKGNVQADIHKDFVDHLTELGYSDDDYPLCTDSQASWSVWKLCKSLESKHFREIALAKGGRDAARRADASNPMRLLFPVNRPYLRVELDSHLLHAIFVVTIEELDGTERTVTLKRLSVLAAIDADTRAILGYRISMNAQPTIEDVALTLAHVLDPLDETARDVLGYQTGRGIGLPDSLIAQCRFRCFDELALDNALAHTSPTLHTALFEHVNCTVNLGKSAHPEGRALIEAWFKLLNRYLCKPLPSTTGSRASDPQRRSPAEKAMRYEISLHDLEALIETVIRGHNQKTPETTHGRSPLEQLRYRMSQLPGLVRRLRPCDRNLEFLFKRAYPATIAGSVARGDRPYVQFKRAVYKNQQLSSMGALIGTKVTLIVDIRDLRCIEAVLASGQSIGILQAQGGWALTPHSLQTRRAINRHINRTRIRGRIGDYVRWYVADLATNRKDSASTPNIVTRINREIEAGRNTDAEDDPPQENTPRTSSWARFIDIGPDLEFDEGD